MTARATVVELPVRRSGPADWLKSYLAMLRWEVDTFRWLCLSAMVTLGQFRNVELEAARFYEEAESRADRYVTTSLQLGAPFFRFLTRGDVDAAGSLLHGFSSSRPDAPLEVKDLLLARAHARRVFGSFRHAESTSRASGAGVSAKA